MTNFQGERLVASIGAVSGMQHRWWKRRCATATRGARSASRWRNSRSGATASSSTSPVSRRRAGSPTAPAISTRARAGSEEISMAKLFARRSDAEGRLRLPAAPRWNGLRGGDRRWRARSAMRGLLTIGGGTSEIMKEIIAKLVPGSEVRRRAGVLHPQLLGTARVPGDAVLEPGRRVRPGLDLAARRDHPAGRPSRHPRIQVHGLERLDRVPPDAPICWWRITAPSSTCSSSAVPHPPSPVDPAGELPGALETSSTNAFGPVPERGLHRRLDVPPVLPERREEGDEPPVHGHPGGETAHAGPEWSVFIPKGRATRPTIRMRSCQPSPGRGAGIESASGGGAGVHSRPDEQPWRS